MSKHTGNSYLSIATKYAELQDQQPFTLYFERPGFLAFLPPLENKRVLDAGCGPGFYSAYCLQQGASVTAFDLNSEFVAYTKERTKGNAEVLQADLAEPLAFAEDSSFDVIVCALVLHYLEDWLPTLKEFRRVLKPTGQLIFSTHHPFTDWKEFEKEDYFAIDLLEDEWDVGKVQFYRRPLRKISDDLGQAGFLLERIGEPQPLQPPEGIVFKSYEKLMKNPWRLYIAARPNDQLS
jgi:SAM-dependent methyltransferase